MIPYASLFSSTGKKYGVDPALLAAVARAESNFNPNAVSPAGALGLMQIMPDTAAHLGVNPMDPTQAVDGAARLFAANLRQFKGDLALAIAAYNAGPGAVYKYAGVPPYSETQSYVQKVLAFQREYAGAIGTEVSPAMKAILVVGGGVAALTAAFYVANGRLPTRRDLGR